jgi:hypothetical protein
MAGWYKQPVQYGRESAHKNWTLGNHSYLRDYIYEIHHINEEENVLINRPPTFSYISMDTGISPGARILMGARILSSA